ncbi:MAG: 50S ribosomal protein L30 [Capsulimonas sp.]|jgi:large subunit ribosomal protein L30|uniref:50S ribosomal protein L30 n=1 Tax=Capsulimonas sp. TaxID=2494211 RepID=UPI003267A2E1
MSALKITLKKSLIGYEKSQAQCARALGLGKVGSSVVQPDNACIRGSIKKLVHVLNVETVEGDAPGPRLRARRSAATLVTE